MVAAVPEAVAVAVAVPEVAAVVAAVPEMVGQVVVARAALMSMAGPRRKRVPQSVQSVPLVHR